jgi:hypothetical protein
LRQIKRARLEGEVEGEERDGDDQCEEEGQAELPFHQRRRHWIAKECPYPATSVNVLKTEHGATEFLPALQKYVQSKLPAHPHKIVPGQFDRFDVYKQVVIKRPPNPYLALVNEKDHAHTSRRKPGSDRKLETAARFDTVLVADEHRPKDSAGLDGLRAARLRVIFQLPRQFGYHPEPLAYVEWYTPFQRQDASTKMWILKPATNNGHALGEVIPLRRLERVCHLVPKPLSRTTVSSWTSSNVLDRTNEFWFNWWVNLDMWTTCCLPPMGLIQRRAREANNQVDAGA